MVHFVLKVVGFGEEKNNKKLERQIMSGFDQQNIIGCHRTDILMKTKKKKSFRSQQQRTIKLYVTKMFKQTQ